MREQYKGLQIKIPVHDFSLHKTLLCGQTFRVFKKGNDFIVPFQRSVLKLSQDNNELHCDVYGKPISEQELKRFLGLNDDIEVIDRELSGKVENFSAVIRYGKGLRIMCQNPYETTVSFLFSIQSNIPVIKSRLNLLSEIAGEAIQVENKTYYLFPESKELRRMSRKETEKLHLGFREKWFLEFVQKYDEGFFENLSKKSFEEEESTLLNIKGVGVKVAHCILLFSMNELSAFPVDVWIKRGMEKLFNIKSSSRKVAEAGRQLFGRYAGYAQEYMYYYMRNVMTMRKSFASKKNQEIS